MGLSPIMPAKLLRPPAARESQRAERYRLVGVNIGVRTDSGRLKRTTMSKVLHEFAQLAQRK